MFKYSKLTKSQFYFHTTPAPNYYKLHSKHAPYSLNPHHIADTSYLRDGRSFNNSLLIIKSFKALRKALIVHDSRPPDA